VAAALVVVGWVAVVVLGLAVVGAGAVP